MAEKERKGSGGHGGIAVNDDLRRKIAEALLFGAEPVGFAQPIAGRGIVHALAVSQIERAM